MLLGFRLERMIEKVTKRAIFISFFSIIIYQVTNHLIVTKRLFNNNTNEPTKAKILSTSVSLKVSRLQTTLQNSWQNITTNCPNNNSGTYPGCSERLNNVFNKPRKNNNVNIRHITMATHGGVSKLDRVLTQSKWWGGPVSAAVYVNKAQDLETLVTFVDSHKNDLTNVTIHTFLEHSEDKSYPHNILRNLALDNVKTDYVLTMDADFITNFGAHDKMFDLLTHDAEISEKLHSKYMFALPPFNILPEEGNEVATEDQLPTTKDQMMSRLRKNKADEFYKTTNRSCNKFHDYKKWYKGGRKKNGSSSSSNCYTVEYRKFMEPYVLAYRHGLPPYCEELRGYGHNKESWFWLLGTIMDYKFSILQEFFVSHLHHPVRSDSEKVQGEERNDPIYKDYQERMEKMYKNIAKNKT